MHLGITTRHGIERPMLRLAGGADGCISRDGRVGGCYLHGLFANDPFRRTYLKALSADSGESAYEQRVEATLDAFANHLKPNLDLAALLAAARPACLRPRA